MVNDTRRSVVRLSFPLAVVLAFVAWAIGAGQDVNVDRMNYHTYIAYALIDWRYDRDVMPGGPQTFLNPIPYLIPYELGRVFPVRIATGVLAAMQAGSVVLAMDIARSLSDSKIVIALATIVAGTTAILVSEIGTSFEELLLAVGPLAGISLVVRSSRSGDPTPRAFLASGSLTGLALGLKITLLPLAVALLCATCAMPGQRFRRTIAVGLGLAAGSLVSGGAWCLFVWKKFGNPFFPFLNNLFRSPAADPIAFGDAHSFFHGVAAALGRPVSAAITGVAPPLDSPFRDARPLCGLLLAALWLATTRRPRGRNWSLGFLSVYLLCGEAAWLVLCPIERYGLVLDMLAGLAAVLIVDALVPGRLVAAGLALALVAWTRPTDFFHRSWATAYTARIPPALGTGFDLVLLRAPLGYWAAASPRPHAVFGLLDSVLRPGGVTQRRFDAGVTQSPPGRLWAVGLDDGIDHDQRANMTVHGLVLRGPCYRAESMTWIPAVFCRGEIVPGNSRFAAASDLALGTTVAFTDSGDGWIYEVDGWDPAGPAATPVDGHAADLALRTDHDGPLLMSLWWRTRDPAAVTITAGGLTTTARPSPATATLQHGSFCIGRLRRPGGVIPIRIVADGADALELASLRLSAAAPASCP